MGEGSRFLRVLGLDPGTLRCGYCVLDYTAGTARLVELGTWSLGHEQRDLGYRLEHLSSELRALLTTHNPQRVGLERAVSFRNVASALVLSEARGVCRLAVFETLAHAERRLVEISPTQVKKAAVGYGSASKDQVSRFLAKRFRMTEPQAAALGPDSFDAVAVAWATCLVLAKEGVRSGRGGIDGNELRSADQG